MRWSAATYPNLGFLAALYVPLAAIAFYVTYFSVILAPRPWLEHVHFVFMVLWLALIIVQPLLIKYKRFALHRYLGRASIGVVPLVLITAFGLLRMGFVNRIKALQRESWPMQESLGQAADEARLGFIYIVCLAVCFALAIRYRHTLVFHSRYMVAAMLAVTGPIVDRIFFITLDISHFGPIPAESVSFLIIDASLAVLLWMDRRDGQPTLPLQVSLGIYGVMQVLYFAEEKSTFWHAFASLIFQPDL